MGLLRELGFKGLGFRQGRAGKGLCGVRPATSLSDKKQICVEEFWGLMLSVTVEKLQVNPKEPPVRALIMRPGLGAVRRYH